MKVKLQVLKNMLDDSQKVYMVLGINSKIIDGKEYLPVVFDLVVPRLAWVNKEAYEMKKTIMEMEWDAM